MHKSSLIVKNHSQPKWYAIVSQVGFFFDNTWTPAAAIKESLRCLERTLVLWKKAKWTPFGMVDAFITAVLLCLAWTWEIFFESKIKVVCAGSSNKHEYCTDKGIFYFLFWWFSNENICTTRIVSAWITVSFLSSNCIRSFIFIFKFPRYLNSANFCEFFKPKFETIN